MTFKERLLSQLPDMHLHPLSLVIQPKVNSMAMCVLQATIALKGVQCQAPVLQVENQYLKMTL